MMPCPRALLAAGRCRVYELVAACVMGLFSGKGKRSRPEMTVLPKPQHDEAKRGLPVNGADGVWRRAASK